jgi:GAF domain-containing protein
MIVNADPVLDLGDAARTPGLRLRSCLSAPVIADAHLVGVLTLYSQAAHGFTDEDRRVVEGVARQIADTFKHATDVETPAGDSRPVPTVSLRKQAKQAGGYSSKARG